MSSHTKNTKREFDDEFLRLIHGNRFIISEIDFLRAFSGYGTIFSKFDIYEATWAEALLKCPPHQMISHNDGLSIGNSKVRGIEAIQVWTYAERKTMLHVRKGYLFILPSCCEITSALYGFLWISLVYNYLIKIANWQKDNNVNDYIQIIRLYHVTFCKAWSFIPMVSCVTDPSNVYFEALVYYMWIVCCHIRCKPFQMFCFRCWCWSCSWEN